MPTLYQIVSVSQWILSAAERQYILCAFPDCIGFDWSTSHPMPISKEQMKSWGEGGPDRPVLCGSFDGAVTVIRRTQSTNYIDARTAIRVSHSPPVVWRVARSPTNITTDRR